MTPEGYWLFARAWNRVEVFTVAMACAEAARDKFFSAGLIVIVGIVVSITGKAKFGL